MEKNYKVRIMKEYQMEPLVNEFYEEVGPAMVRVKTYGNEMYRADKCSVHYVWSISNWKPHCIKGEIERVNGIYNREWNPVIQEVETN